MDFTEQDKAEEWFNNSEHGKGRIAGFVPILMAEYAKHYHESKVKTLGLFSVVNRRELLLDFADYSESDKTSQTTDECVDNYLDSIK